MRLSYMLVLPVAAAMSVSALAAGKPVPAKTVESITCHDFVELRDTFKPQAVSYAIGYTKAKHPEIDLVDLSGVERAVPVIVQSCKAKPHETLLQRVRALWNRL